MNDAPGGRLSAMAEQQIGQHVVRLLDEALAEQQVDRRAEPRFPFFRPVSIQPAGEPEHRYSAFAREISRTGVGLLHNMPLATGAATLTIHSTQGSPLCTKVEVIWCRPCGEGWFLSGCRFVDLVS